MSGPSLPWCLSTCLGTLCRKAINISVGTSFAFYLSVAITGYLALGNNTYYMVGWLAGCLGGLAFLVGAMQAA